MSGGEMYLRPSEAAQQLGVSAKALRLYEQRGLVKPVRTAAGWRAYGPQQLKRAAEIVALRAMGLSLASIGRALNGEAGELERALTAHQAVLERQAGQITAAIARVHQLRADLAQGRATGTSDICRLVQPATEVKAAFALPWPWGGEWFELRDVRAINYIVGPLGSGKTRFARCIADTLPRARFIGLERAADGGAAARRRIEDDPRLKARVDEALAWLIEDGASQSGALLTLLADLEAGDASALVVDMVEQGLDQATQEALIAHLRRRSGVGPVLFLMTRSSAVLDLAAVSADEGIILCPANHRPPTRVAPHPGSPGYEAVATCLAPPDVRARTEGVIAWRPEVA